MADFSINLRVYVEDTDYAGVVYHVNYLNFMERARTELLISRGFSLKKLEDLGYIIAVYKANIDYLKPAYLNDEIVVTAKTDRLRSSSLDFSQTVYNKHDKSMVYSRGEFRIVCLDKQRRRPTLIPKELREVLQ